jgi:hypothetical protein
MASSHLAGEDRVNAAAKETRRSIWSGVLAGVGLVAFIDETVFHQLLALASLLRQVHVGRRAGVGRLAVRPNRSAGAGRRYSRRRLAFAPGSGSCPTGAAPWPPH